MKEANYTKDSCPWSPLKKSCASCGAVATNSCTKCYLPYCYECSANLEEGKCLAGGEHWFPRVPKLIQPPVNSSYHRSVVLWIPHFHDFFMFHIPAALIYCCRLCLLSPVDFLAKPLIWLKACHQFKFVFFFFSFFSFFSFSFSFFLFFSFFSPSLLPSPLPPQPQSNRNVRPQLRPRPRCLKIYTRTT